MPQRLAFNAAFGTLLLASFGCGNPAGPVTGKITVAGQPLKGGTISFVPKDNLSTPPVTGIIQDDGTFSVQELPFGEMLVAIVPAPLQTPAAAGAAAVSRKRMIERNRRQGLPPPPEALPTPQDNPPEPPPELVPKVNQDPFTTNLTFTHDAGHNEYTHDF